MLCRVLLYLISQKVGPTLYNNLILAVKPAQTFSLEIKCFKKTMSSQVINCTFVNK